MAIKTAYGFRLTIGQIGPATDPDYLAAPASVKKAIMRVAVLAGLEAKDDDLAAGLDKDGHLLHAIAPATRQYRKSAMGPADPNAPPLTPAYGLSRTRSLLDGRAMDGYAEFFWRYDEHTGASWGRILNIHRKGKGSLPVRDVIGMSPLSVAAVRAVVMAWWAAYKAKLAAGKSPEQSLEAVAVAALAAKPGPAAAKAKAAGVPPAKIPVIGRTDFQNAVFASADGASRAKAALAAGYHSGFYQKPPPGSAPPPAPPAPPKAKPKPFVPAVHPTVPDRKRKPGGRPSPALPEPIPAKKPKKAPAKPKGPPKPKPAAFPADPESGLTVVKALGGSTGAELVKDAAGTLYVRKRGNNPDHLREEAIADAAYRALGVSVPDSRLYETASGPVKLAKFIPGQTLQDLRQADPVLAEKAEADLRKNFVADALLANWDVVGLAADNILVDASGKAYRIDNGGSLRFRAQGGKKGSGFGTTVGELASLRDSSINPSSARVFGSISREEIAKQAKALAKPKVRAALLAALPADLRPIMTARLDAIEAVAKAKPPKPVAGWAPLPASDFRAFTTDDAASEAWGKATYQSWANGLSAKDKHAVKTYTGGAYTAINNGLRSGQIPTTYKTDIEALTASLLGQKLPEGIVVTRGISGTLETLGTSRADIRPGLVLTDLAFNSTTLKPKPSFGSGPRLTIRLPKGAPGAYMNAAERFSSHPGELEFLIPAGSAAYRVVEHTIVNGVDHVTLQWEPAGGPTTKPKRKRTPKGTP